MSLSFSFNQNDTIHTHSIENEVQPVKETIISSGDEELDVKENPNLITNLDSSEIPAVVARLPPYDGIPLTTGSPVILDE